MSRAHASLMVCARTLAAASSRPPSGAYTRDNRLKIASNVRLLEAFRAEMGDGVLKRFHKRFPSIY